MNTDIEVVVDAAVAPPTAAIKQDGFEALLSSLGTPIHRGDRYAIYHGDCLEFLTSLPDSSIDLTFTSPPYNIGKEYESVLSLDQYVDWCVEWCAEIARITRRHGSFLLNVGYLAVPEKGRSVPIPYLLWNKFPMFLQQEIVWNYGAGVAARKALSPRNEKLLWYVRDAEQYTFNLDEIRDPDVAYPNQKKNGKLRCNTLGKNPSDVWQIAKVTSGAGRSSPERTSHPAQFPLDLCERVLKGFSNSGDFVVDPFLGSGSTLDATERFGRFGIGFELRRDYCDLAEKRIRATQAQLKLAL
ncbi:MAG TPA: site-specific DNA-methyltransferase [Usitatibacter sp.]|jgi:adenine-specific DNA-methyltransferase|nr:site-specific DNA-methyltransferase [Usitatibacter sp.]